MLLNLRQRLANRFFAILDSEGVVFFQAIVYTYLAVGGAYNAFIAHGAPPDIAHALGSFSPVWLALCMGATICLAGKVMAFDKRQFWVRTAGRYLELAGDLAAFGAFTGYVLAAVQESAWGDPLSSPFTYAALATCAFFLCWRDLRRIKEAELSVRG